MKANIYSALAEALETEGIIIDEIKDVESEDGSVSFKYRNKDYSILIE